MWQPMKPKAGHLFSKDLCQADYISENLESLVEYMAKWQKSIDSAKEPAGSEIAGYSYLAQFFAHDVTSREGTAKRSAGFDLDSVYGVFPPDDSSPLNNQDRFELGNTVDRENQPKRQGLDLRRTKRIADIPEPRNDENLAIAQFHLLVQRFHNAVVNKGSLTKRKAARIVVTVMQHIFFSDFLPKFTDNTVRDACENHNYFDLQDEDELPVEFNDAAMRFGHSLIRSSYKINQQTRPISLRLMFKLTGERGLLDGRHFDQIPDDRVIDWPLFFDEYNAQRLLALDPHIAPPMLPVARANLLTAVNRRLCSGQKAVAELNQRLPLAEHGITLTTDVFPKPGHLMHQPTLDLGLQDQAPLWLFILLEANFIGNGKALGPLGSLLVCECTKEAKRRANTGMTIETAYNHLDLNEPINTLDDLYQFVTTQENV